ncbi:energy transducer TonB [Spirosoma utsteinense]|uniref:Protein TonB n=1 Tax=Spirosoma utsteinense TaxID=2585773 RepID=A0ABR6WB99_9BACT|nr:energy transducer TonB [Spirosoma utsteinense]MBC3786792.1 protein TonB [Spirosoma utsteinense]MBC3793787.1 protein TonB [Spirosoma utsteinense]
MLNPNSSNTVALTYDEIIFQSRNRAYGAFNLRQHYRPTLTLALGLGVGLFLAGLYAPTLYSRIWPGDQLANTDIMVQADIIELTEPPAERPLPPVEQAPAVNTVRNLVPIVMPEADVVEDALPPTTDDLQDATSGPLTADGTGDVDVIAPPEASAATADEKALEVAPRTEDVFVAVEQEPQYPGGLDALRTFLSRSLNYPRAAASAGVSGKVFLSFVVNTDGSLTDIQVLKGIGFGCDEEAVRVIRKMPNWRPGKQSGRAVRVKYNLPISFTLE